MSDIKAALKQVRIYRSQFSLNNITILADMQLNSFINKIPSSSFSNVIWFNLKECFGTEICREFNKQVFSMRACILSVIPLNNRHHHSDKSSTWALVKEENKTKLEEEKTFFFSNFFPENLIISNCCDITPCLTYETPNFCTDTSFKWHYKTPTRSDTRACNPEPARGYKTEAHARLKWHQRATYASRCDLLVVTSSWPGKTPVLYNAAIGG